MSPPEALHSRFDAWRLRSRRARLPMLVLVSLVAALVALPRPARCGEPPVPLPPSPLRPGAESGATRISVGIWIADISQIDSASQTFTANMVTVLRWRDAQLVHPGPGTKRYNLEDVWHPYWLVANAVGGVEGSLPETVEVAPDGNVIYRQRWLESFSQSLDLRAFPFDHDTFRVHFVIGRYRPNEIEFVPDESAVAAGLSAGAGIAEGLTLPDWTVTSFTTRPLPYTVAPGLEVAGYVFEFTAERNSGHFVLKVIMPLVLIVMMSWAVFWIEPGDANSQLAVAVTAMLTLIAFRFAVDSDVPRLPYLTRLDAFILASTLLVFLSLIEVMVTNKLANSDRLGLARTIDRYSRVIFPILFAVALAGSFGT